MKPSADEPGTLAAIGVRAFVTLLVALPAAVIVAALLALALSASAS